MRQLNTIPIEDFLDKARIAIKTNQKTVVLTIKEVADLQSSLATVMTRLAGNAEQPVSAIEVKMDGGRF
jgi:hypothetical protein